MKWSSTQTMMGYFTFLFNLGPPTFASWGYWVPESKEYFFDFFMFFLFPPDCWWFLGCLDCIEFTIEVCSRIRFDLVINIKLGFPSTVSWLRFPPNWPMKRLEMTLTMSSTWGLGVDWYRSVDGWGEWEWYHIMCMNENISSQDDESDEYPTP